MAIGKVKAYTQYIEPNVVYYLYMKQLISDAFCPKGAVEKNHYLIECLTYSVLRREMFDTVDRISDVTEVLLLFGDTSLSNEDNEVIFRAVHKFIHLTKRFS